MILSLGLEITKRNGGVEGLYIEGREERERERDIDVHVMGVCGVNALSYYSFLLSKPKFMPPPPPPLLLLLFCF